MVLGKVIVFPSSTYRILYTLGHKRMNGTTLRRRSNVQLGDEGYQTLVKGGYLVKDIEINERGKSGKLKYPQYMKGKVAFHQLSEKGKVLFNIFEPNQRLSRSFIANNLYIWKDCNSKEWLYKPLNNSDVNILHGGKGGLSTEHNSMEQKEGDDTDVNLR